MDMAKKGSSEFVTLNEEAVKHRYLQVSLSGENIRKNIREVDVSGDSVTLTLSYCILKVSGLEEGETYVFRVRAANDHGVGKPSQLSEPVCARALPGNSQSECSLV